MNHQKHIREELILFTRYPRAGKAKTRLIPELGAEGAAKLQRSMTERVVSAARQVTEERNAILSIYFFGSTQEEMANWLGRDLFYQQQKGPDLGKKMLNAFLDAWKRDADHVVLIGSDCPALDRQLLSQAMTALRDSQFVLGPAVDGGYYLVGATRSLPEKKLTRLLTDIAWGTSEVLSTTLSRAADTGIIPSILKELHDIDNPSDLAYLRHNPDP